MIYFCHNKNWVCDLYNPGQNKWHKSKKTHILITMAPPYPLHNVGDYNYYAEMCQMVRINKLLINIVWGEWGVREIIDKVDRCTKLYRVT